MTRHTPQKSGVFSEHSEKFIASVPYSEHIPNQRQKKLKSIDFVGQFFSNSV